MATVFTIQVFIEDQIVRCGMQDIDQYAVRIANLYDVSRFAMSSEEFQRRMRRVPTVMYKNASGVSRGEFEADLLERLDKRFEKKNDSTLASFPAGFAKVQRKFRKRRTTIRDVMCEFQNTIEARAIDAFWESRSKNLLRRKPERIAQSYFATFARGVLRGNGILFRELSSGTGFVDFAIVLSRVPHLIEVKILKSKFTGVGQLAKYMSLENRKEGWLLVLDARPHTRKTAEIPERIDVENGVIRVVTVDINPIPPSRLP